MTTMQREGATHLSDDDFKYVCQFTYKSAGIVLNDSKREMVYRRFMRIIRDRKLPSFSAYCQLLRNNPEQERHYFVNAITTNLTSFFREQHHFDYLQSHEYPRLLESKLKKRLRIWSSASSSGEEPYSIAISLLEAFGDKVNQWDAKILATDIDSNVLAKGQAGVYPEQAIDELPIGIKKQYFQKGKGELSKQVRVNDELRKLITFNQLNLLGSWPMKGPFDIIFCRNVIIYFDKETQSELFKRYYHMLAPGGLLILGHSENLGRFQQYFENVGRTIFRKPNEVIGKE